MCRMTPQVQLGFVQDVYQDAGSLSAWRCCTSVRSAALPARTRAAETGNCSSPLSRSNLDLSG